MIMTLINHRTFILKVKSRGQDESRISLSSNSSAICSSSAWQRCNSRAAEAAHDWMEAKRDCAEAIACSTSNQGHTGHTEPQGHSAIIEVSLGKSLMWDSWHFFGESRDNIEVAIAVYLRKAFIQLLSWSQDSSHTLSCPPHIFQKQDEHFGGQGTALRASLTLSTASCCCCWQTFCISSLCRCKDWQVSWLKRILFAGRP